MNIFVTTVVVLLVGFSQSMRITQDSFDGGARRRYPTYNALGKSPMRQSTRNLMNEINTYQHGLRTPSKHRVFMDSLLANSWEEAVQPANMASLMKKDFQLRYISSISAIGDGKEKNQSIHDRIWEWAIQYGASVVQPGVENRFYVTFAFSDFLVLRYLYESIPDAKPYSANVNFVQLQFHLFRKLVHVSEYKCQEYWRLRHQDDGFLLWDVEKNSGRGNLATREHICRLAFQKAETRQID